MSSNQLDVLLVEDNETDFLLAAHALKSTASLRQAKSLKEALSMISKLPLPDVVLLDLNLPDSEGIETFDLFQSQGNMLPIVVLSGHDDESLAILAVKKGAQDYLVKGKSDSEALLRAIRYAIERKRADALQDQIGMLEQREEFMAMLAHDLQVPLIGANRICNLILDGSLDRGAKSLEDLVALLRTTNERMLDLIRKLLEIYRYETGGTRLDLRAIDVRPVVENCLEEVSLLAHSRQIKIESHLPDKPAICQIDKTALKRLVINLLDNALKFTDVNGSIDVSIDSGSQGIELKVKDTGLGISKADQAKLFKHFWQGEPGKHYVATTGLGLYLCQKIVQAHAGEIFCSSQPGEGTTFTVTFPGANGSSEYL